MVVVRRLGVLSFARIQALVMMVLGLIIALVQAVFFSVASGANSPLVAGVSPTDVYWAILTLPVFWGILGFISSLLVAWLYNSFASWAGGIEVELEGASPVMPLKKSRR